MKFTEREMTIAVEAVARQLMIARKPFARGDADQRWRELTPIARYENLAAAGELVLPVLIALPERPTVGSAPAFSPEEYDAAASEASGSRVDDSERLRRRRAKLTAHLARVAVEAMPPRQDPDALVVPDHL